MPGQLFIISGLSGSGKSTILNAIKKKDDELGYSISHTTRKPRKDEKQGVHYHFVKRETFFQMITDGAFIEWATVYDEYYGTSFKSLKEQTSQDIDVLLDLDEQGAKNINKHFENNVLIYILPPSLKILEQRLFQRGTDDDQVIKKRMAVAHKIIKKIFFFDYLIINDDLEKAITEVQAIIQSERCRTLRRMQVVTNLFDIQEGETHS